MTLTTLVKITTCTDILTYNDTKLTREKLEDILGPTEVEELGEVIDEILGYNSDGDYQAFRYLIIEEEDLQDHMSIEDFKKCRREGREMAYLLWGKENHGRSLNWEEVDDSQLIGELWK